MKIGFIDYYLDEWHAENYPTWIQEASGNEMKVAYAYAAIDSPNPNGLTTEQWCNKHQIQQCNSIEEVIEKSDSLIVLSPDHCEMHEQLSRLALQTGKKTYIDKTFAPDKDSAVRMFDLAEQYATPCYSASALRFSTEYTHVKKMDIISINSWGPGYFDNYSIHQLEPVIMLMQSPVKRVMCLPKEDYVLLICEFNDGRTATISQYAKGSPFMMNICGKKDNKIITVQSDYFKEFIKELVDFFRTGQEKVPHKETISIMATRSAGIKAMNHPGEWITL